MNEICQEEIFFNYLIEKTKKTYKQSPVYEKYNGENWNYAICDTPIKKNAPVLFGLNWGGKNHNTQDKMPKKNYLRKFKLAKHANKYLKKYFLVEIDNINYTNLCFFRTPSTKHLTHKDWELSFPLFKEFIEFIQPPFCIMLGKPNMILKKHIKNFKTIVYESKGEKKAYAYVGI
ncbi:hypothetical protein [Flavobacteriaceae bacterium 14752]|uniref:hypothetical protein n=1 Tax=Mesohalobacter salilacus TaxID=2491711 RepID=UPI000F63B7C3|nr:hypothetical protein EIG84_04575 [Flavobacteriaceae bacterium 14752]